MDSEVEIKGKVISVLNMKGGVGKTTITKEIGYHLSTLRDKKVLLIDVDPQLNLTQSLFRFYGFAQTEELAKKILVEEEQLQEELHEITTEESKNLSEEKKKEVKLKISEASIERVFSSTTSSPAKEKEAIQILAPNLHIIPGELGVEFTLRNLNSGKIENGIYEFIKKNNLRNKYHYIIIDCPPTYSSYTIAALKPSDYLLIPVKPEAYSITGVDMLMNVIKSVVEENDPYFETKPLKNLGIIFTDIKQSPSIGTTKLIKDITDSEKIAKHQINIFATRFLSNAYMKNRLDYFIDASNSEKSKLNLEVLVDEILERIDELG
ncbi:ParA family protein [Carnobacterium antarcticum]|uniref:ParA family protein n=1 Tax=Carnobacterium antarcticum TaxID=2126436 RepID=A0ABW4NNY1_9LACT|nr:AAA family ATPase [Carnobacterium sp. CP1]ALV20716.1 Chromosome partitioning protein ParA [Carnobacterium sp. CP1]